MKNLKLKVTGHVKIDGVLDKFNSINFSNLSTLIARGLTNNQNSNIFKLKIGNGGINADGTLKITKTAAADTDLYSPLNDHTVIIDQQDSAAEPESSITFSIVPGGGIAIVNTIVVKAPQTMTSNIIFNELGLFSKDNLMLSHLTFENIEIQPGTQKILNYAIDFSIVD